jgi:putative acetyltransferase
MQSGFHIHLAGLDDLPAILTLLRDTVVRINRRDYSPEQIRAWTHSVEQSDRWPARIHDQHFIVAHAGDTLAGFASLTPEGCIDLLYVHHAMQHMGVGSLFMDALEHQAQMWALRELWANVSITAIPFFEKHGFVIEKRQQQTIHGIILENVLMRKHIA